MASYPISGDLAVEPLRPLVIVFDQAMDQASIERALMISPTMAIRVEWPSPERLECYPTDGWAAEQNTLLLSSEGASDLGTPLGVKTELSFGIGGRGAPIPVLMYHHLAELDADASESQRTWTVSPAAFEEQMRYLAASGYHTIVPTQLVAYLSAGEPLPTRPLVISMDDGYVDVYDVARPILAELALSGTLFIVPEYVGYGAYLSWEQLEELAAAGHAIGAHGYDHSNLRKASDAALLHQIKGARDLLAERLGVTVDAFCYPYGSYDERTLALLPEHGYTSGYTLNRSIYQTADDLLLINRILVDYETSIEAFRDCLPW